MKKPICNHCGAVTDGAYDGMTCTECNTGTIVTQEDPQQKEWDQRARSVLRGFSLRKLRRSALPTRTPPRHTAEVTAQQCHNLAIVFVVIAVIVFIGGFFAQAGEDHFNSSFITWAGGMCSAAFLFEFLAQLLFIRAAVERMADR